jgi:hypothetical protein
MTLNLYVSPTKIQLAFDTTRTKNGEHLSMSLPVDDPDADPDAIVLGSSTAINLFSLNLAALITGDALSPGDGFPTVVDTGEIIGLFIMIKSAHVALPGDNYRLEIPVAF